MTEVIFHFNVDDKCGHACGYVRKALANARKVGVLGDDEQLERIDQALWGQPHTAFVAHCFVPAASVTMLAASPVLLGSDASLFPHRDILVNLSDQVPEGFGAFERVVELVGGHEADVQASRQRWKFYRERGYALRSVDMLQRAGARGESV